MNGSPKKSSQMVSSGYSHPLYAASLKEFGKPLELQSCQGWLLQRSITDCNLNDAMGCYPIFSCLDWSRLRTDLDFLETKLVSVTLVTDPFGNYNKAFLLSCFDYVLPFKEHFVADLERPLESYISASHLRFAHQAQRQIQIEVCTDPKSKIDQWCKLHGELVVRKGITGIRAFSRSAFEKQLTVPGIVMFQAFIGQEILGLDWWYIQGDVAQGHLVAMSTRGYELHTGYALKLAILEYFKGRVRWINLTGIPGSGNSGSEGLAAFKRGWSSGTRTAWLCGRILDKKTYAELIAKKKVDPNNLYFPSYRQGELV